MSSPICVPDASKARMYIGELSKSDDGPDSAQMETVSTSDAKKMLPTSPPPFPNCKPLGRLYAPPSGLSITEGSAPGAQMLAFPLKVTPGAYWSRDVTSSKLIVLVAAS